MKKKVVMIKLGGSLITNKSKPYSLREEVLVDVVKQVKRAWGEEYLVILGHGSGSFAHVPAEKYKTIEGKVGDESVYGYAVVEDAASKLNRLVVDECLKQGLPAVSMRISNMVLAGLESQRFVKENVKKVLELGLLPVFFGDTVLGGERDFTIWSTEKILNFLAVELESDFEIKKIIHCGETEGFMVDGKVVESIDQNSFEELKKHVHETNGFDVTGGMLHKVEEALESAKRGVDSYIVGGLKKGNLYKTLIEERFVGTKITFSKVSDEY